MAIRWRSAGAAVAANVSIAAIAATLTLAACSGGSDASSTSDPAPPVTASPTDTEAAADQLARAAVQTYLDAMKGKDVTKASTVVCAEHRAELTANATSTKGDFADTFAVVSTEIT